jgi:hypothetical protein
MHTPGSSQCSKHVPLLATHTQQQLTVFTLCPTLLLCTQAHTHDSVSSSDCAQSSAVCTYGGLSCSVYAPVFNYTHKWQDVLTTWPIKPQLTHNQEVSWLKLLVTGLSPPRPRLDPSPINVGFMVGKGALGHVCLRVLWFSMLLSFHLCPMLILSSVTDAV